MKPNDFIAMQQASPAGREIRRIEALS